MAMTVERLDPDQLATFSSEGPEAIRRFIEGDFRMRSGLCPNGCGLLAPNSYGQECPGCNFSCNTAAESGPAQ